jgi:signal transduction histidine kinase
LSRAERGKLVVDVQTINVKALVESLAKNYLGDAKKKGLKLDVHIPEHTQPLFSSELYVREILQNFITNAIKYTEEGGVTISTKANEKGIYFIVSDTGIGISNQDQEKVFDKFFRSEDYRTRKNNGTGLGLYVTIKLSRLIHADIELKSELNKGSTFSIFIPNLTTVPTTAQTLPATQG